VSLAGHVDDLVGNPLVTEPEVPGRFAAGGFRIGFSIGVSGIPRSFVAIHKRASWHGVEPASMILRAVKIID